MAGKDRVREDIVAGRQSVLELLRAGRPVSKIYIAKGMKQGGNVEEIERTASSRKIPLIQVDRRKIDEMVDSAVHQGVVALVEPFAYASLGELLNVAATKEKAVIIALDGVTDPHNVGALIRTAEAAGASGLILPKRRSAGISPTVHKSSAGAVEHLTIAQVGNLVSALEDAKAAGYWIYGAAADAGQNLYQADFGDKAVLVLGSEGAGLSRLVKETCDVLVSIPMAGKTASLNVSVAGALFIYEALLRPEVKGRS